MTAVQHNLEEAVARFREEVLANRRMVRMLWLVVYLTLGYGIVGFLDLFDEKGAEIARLTERLAAVGSIEAKATWDTRVEAQQVTQSEFKTHCWPAANEGLASADLQTDIQAMISLYELSNTRLNVSSPEFADAQTWRIRAELTGKVGDENLIPLLNDIENSGPHLWLERASIVFSNRGNTLDFLIAACFYAPSN